MPVPRDTLDPDHRAQGPVRELESTRGRAVRPQNVPAAGENCAMPMNISGLDAAIIGPGVFPGLHIKVSSLFLEPDVNAGGAALFLQCPSS